jgi:hypothetical protein
MRDSVQTFWWGRCAWGGMRAVPHLCIDLYPGIRLTTEETSRKTLSRGSRKAPNWTVLGTIRLVDLVAVLRATSTSLLPVTTFDLRQPSVRYVPSCRTKGVPAHAHLASNLSVRDLMWSAKNGTPKSSWICLLLMYQGVNTLGLNHLQPPDMGTGGGPTDWAPVVHDGTVELLVKQNTVPYRQSTPPVQERPQANRESSFTPR